MQEIIDFISNPTGIGIVALAILGLIFLIKEAITFLQSNVLPEYFKWQLERRKLVVPFAEKVLDKNQKEPSFFRPSFPKYIDFEQGFVMERPEAEVISSKFKRHRFVHVEGLPSSGKSVIALTIAYREIKARHLIIYFSRPSLISDHFLNNLLSSLQDEFDKKNALIIVDDVHLDVATASRLFAPIYGKYEDTRLLFISRPLTPQHNEELADAQYSFTTYMDKIEISADHALTYLPEFYSRKKFGKDISPLDKSLFVNECGNDVLLLGRYLTEWNGISPANIESIRSKVFKKVFEDLESMRQTSPDAVKVLLIVGMFYRFEVPIEEQFLKKLELDISNLVRSGELRKENGFVSLYHSSLAKLYSNAIRDLEMPDFAEFSSRYSPFPQELFKEYIRLIPRNTLDLIIGLRVAPSMLEEIIKDRSLTPFISEAIIHEQSLGQLGWALVVLKATDSLSTWRILEKADFYIHAVNMVPKATSSEVTIFMHNLSKVSNVKLNEWLGGIPIEHMVSILSESTFNRFAVSMRRIKKANEEYFERLIEVVDPSVVCRKFLEEQDITRLAGTLSVLLNLMRGYLDIRSGSRTDFTGEKSTRVSLYVKNQRVTKTIPGRRLGIPGTSSLKNRRLHAFWLWDNRSKDCWISVDEGAERILVEKRASLFPVGIHDVYGEFDVGDVVAIRNQKNEDVGAGVSNYSSSILRQIKGMRTEAILKTYPNVTPNRVIDNDLIVTQRKLLGLPRKQSRNNFETDGE
jgi:hypothetical protein